MPIWMLLGHWDLWGRELEQTGVERKDVEQNKVEVQGQRQISHSSSEIMSSKVKSIKSTLSPHASTDNASRPNLPREIDNRGEGTTSSRLGVLRRVQRGRSEIPIGVSRQTLTCPSIQPLRPPQQMN